MTDVTTVGRSLDYAVLRTCERFDIREEEFFSFDYDAQLRLLAFNQIRLQEAAASLPRTEL